MLNKAYKNWEICCFHFTLCFRRFPSRPKFNSYCQAGVVPFCPTGEVPNTMPQFHPDDNIEIFALKAPVFEFKLGDLLGKFVSLVCYIQ